MIFSVSVLGEHLSGRTGLGFFVTMVGVSLYKLVPKGPPQGNFARSCSCWESGETSPRCYLPGPYPVGFSVPKITFWS